MKQTVFRPVVVLEFNTDQDAELAELYTHGLHFEPATGCYKGTQSRCYIVDIGHDGDRYGMVNQETLNKVLGLAEAYSQESVLILDSERNAQLYYLETQQLTDLGKLRAVSRLEALQSDAWTYVNSTYYKAGA